MSTATKKSLLDRWSESFEPLPRRFHRVWNNDGLTPRQREVLDAITAHYRKYGVPVTIKGLQAKFGIGSPNGMFQHFKALERKGFLVKLDEPGVRRCYMPVSEVDR